GLVVETSPKGRVQATQDLGTKALFGGDAHAYRRPAAFDVLLVVLGKVPPLVEHPQTHHPPAHLHRAYLFDFDQPACGDPCPWARSADPPARVAMKRP